MIEVTQIETRHGVCLLSVLTCDNRCKNVYFRFDISLISSPKIESMILDFRFLVNHFKMTLAEIYSIFMSLIVAQQMMSMVSASNLNQCELTKTIPIPETYKFRVEGLWPDRWCIVASFAAYLKLDRDRYIKLGKGIVSKEFSFCPNQFNDSYIAVDYDCGHLNLHMTRNIDGSFQVSHAYGAINHGPMGMGIPEAMVTEKVNHSYRCVSDQMIPIVANRESDSMSLIIQDVTLEVYRDESEPDFYQLQDRCYADVVAGS